MSQQPLRVDEMSKEDNAKKPKEKKAKTFCEVPFLVYPQNAHALKCINVYIFQQNAHAYLIISNNLGNSKFQTGKVGGWEEIQGN